MAPATVRELSAAFGLTHPDSVRNLIRRADRALLDSRILHGEIEAIRHRLPNTGPDPAKPSGIEPWCQRIVQRLGLVSTQRPRGRARKTLPEL